MEHSVVATPRLSPHRMEHNMATSPNFLTPTIVVKQRLFVLNLIGGFVQCVHCPRTPMVPFSMLENMDYDGLLTHIKSKFVYLQPELQYFLQSAQSK